ncbi:MAG: ATP synthase F1 subunit delta [Candidatus Magasanikbacteria bacterium]
MSKFPVQYAKILYELTKDIESDSNLEAALDEFVNYLHNQQALVKIDYIIEEFEKLVRRENNEEDVEVHVARKISDELLEDIKENISAEAKVQVKEDQSLLGGVVVKKGNKIMDGSVKTQLQRLKNNLLN